MDPVTAMMIASTVQQSAESDKPFGGLNLPLNIMDSRKKKKEAKQEEKDAKKRRIRSSLFGSIGQVLEEAIINKRQHEQKMMMLQQYMTSLGYSPGAAVQGGGR